MRISFFQEIEKKAQSDKDIFLLTGDLGFKLFDSFKSRFPDRFYDIGVAESNMIGIAAGLCLAGKNVYCYSIIPFLLMRPYEQIRMSVAYNNLNVKLVGVGGGFTYGLEGFTHFALEDIALMRLLPNLAIVNPADPYEAAEVAKLSVDFEGPLYIRLGKTGEPAVHEKPVPIVIGEPLILKEGKDLVLLATGNMVRTALLTSELLSKADIPCSVVDMHTIHPVNRKLLSQILSAHETVVTIEEHYQNGGLGSLITEIAQDLGHANRILRVGISSRVQTALGNSDFLREQNGLTPKHITERIRQFLR